MFCVLLKRLQILFRPRRLFTVEDMELVVKTCTILPNMVCEERRAGYTVSRSCRLRLETEDLETPQESPIIVRNDEEGAGFRKNHLEGIECDDKHFELKHALKSLQWARRAASLH